MRHRWPALITAICALALPGTAAHAADPLISKDTSLSGVQALNGFVVYKKQTGYKKGVWMRVVKGKLRRAKGIPNSVYGTGNLGLDRHGRTVLAWVTEHRKHGLLVSARWHVYDVASDRSRLLKGLPHGHQTRNGTQVTMHGCDVGTVLFWRSRMAYDTSCSSAKRTGLWLKDGKRTRRITSLGSGEIGGLSLRGGTLVGSLMAGPLSEDATVALLAVDGKPCVRYIPGTTRGLESGWAPGFGPWIANGHIVWTMGGWQEDVRPVLFYFTLLGAKLPSHCGAPGPTGRFDFTPHPAGVTGMTLDNRHLFYARPRAIRRHTLPAQPSNTPPGNDNFENAQLLQGDLPLHARGWTAYATTQPGEPMAATAKQTIWYAFRPTTSQTVFVDLGYFFRGKYEIYTGSTVDALMPVPTVQDGFSKRFDAVAGQTYYIEVGTSDNEPLYDPISVEVTLQALHG